MGKRTAHQISSATDLTCEDTQNTTESSSDADSTASFLLVTSDGVYEVPEKPKSSEKKKKGTRRFLNTLHGFFTNKKRQKKKNCRRCALKSGEVFLNAYEAWRCRMMLQEARNFVADGLTNQPRMPEDWADTCLELLDKAFRVELVRNIIKQYIYLFFLKCQ